MKQVSELLKTGLYEPLISDRTRTIKEIIKDINLEQKLFGILINGKIAGINEIVHRNDMVVIIPHLAGGADVGRPIKDVVPDFLFLQDIDLIKLDINAMLKQRKCFSCKTSLSFQDFIYTNRQKKIVPLIKTWQSEKVQIFCCSCFKNAEEQKYIQKMIENDGADRKCSNCVSMIKLSDLIKNYGLNRRKLIEDIWFHPQIHCDKCESELKKKKLKKG